MKLGHDFGRTPFGLHQVLAFARRRRCTCDPRFAGLAVDIACPDHGLAQHLLRLAKRDVAA